MDLERASDYRTFSGLQHQLLSQTPARNQLLDMDLLMKQASDKPADAPKSTFAWPSASTSNGMPNSAFSFSRLLLRMIQMHPPFSVLASTTSNGTQPIYGQTGFHSEVTHRAGLQISVVPAKTRGEKVDNYSCLWDRFVIDLNTYIFNSFMYLTCYSFWNLYQ